MNLPNQITVVRMLLVPVFTVVLMEVAPPAGPLAALAIFAVAAATDKLDGVIARSRGLITTFGKFLDPLADKLLVIAALFCLTAMGRCSPYLGVLIVARELIVTSFRIVAMGSGVELAADRWGKYKTLLQVTSICAILLGLVYEPAAFLGQLLLIAATAMTLFSGWHYLHANWACIGKDM
ncbi:MAG TPA: CDP-diacylglycerol--glycerol-3-phosphate 3-phosphatidyltransferase [Terriglobales bacterium]|nr:CDP-diacylglycerol--glycerol-3-phosphate 3-phosphatidyltransferase [Terriglobales bacterium]